MHGPAYAHPLLLDQLEVIIGSVEILAKIKQETGLNASAGISYNKFLAKLASDHRKPNGQYVITPEMGPAFVENLPVGKFHGIGPATSAKMNSLGLYTGLDMRNQSLEFMQTHFGKAGSYSYWISRGIDNREVRADRIRKSVGAENTFSSDLSEFDGLVAELAPLIDKVWRHCEGTGNRGRTVTLKVKFNDFEIITRSRSMPIAVSSRSDLERLSVALLQNEMALPKPVRLLGVSLSSLQHVEDAEPWRIYAAMSRVCRPPIRPLSSGRRAFPNGLSPSLRSVIDHDLIEVGGNPAVREDSDRKCGAGRAASRCLWPQAQPLS